MTMFFICLPCRVDDHPLCDDRYCDCCAGTGVARSAPTSGMASAADRGAERGATGEHGGSEAVTVDDSVRGRDNNAGGGVTSPPLAHPAGATSQPAAPDKHGQPRAGVEPFTAARRHLFAHHEGTTE